MEERRMNGYILTGLLLALLVVIFYQDSPISAKTEQLILEIVRNNPGIHDTEIARQVRIPVRKIYCYLNVLESEGLIRAFKKNIAGSEVTVYQEK